ncbi:MAG: amidohydrolase [Deltaproteobacteria bacterium]|nr:amidohydrolase [Deltaproteobacteria bacterium]
MKIIDVHAHYCPREYYAKLESRDVIPYVRPAKDGALDLRYGRGKSSRIREGMFSLSRRLEEMDEKGITVQVLSPLLHGVHRTDAKTGLELCRLVNDGVAEVIQKHKGRFEGFAVLPLQGVNEALEELERSIKDLELKGIIFLSNVEGRFLDERRFWPIYEAISSLGVPIFLHPTYPVNDKGMQDYALISPLGFLYDTTLAMLRIIFSGLLEEYRDLKFILPHLGSVLPYIIARIDREPVSTRSKRKIQHPPSEYFNLVYVDTVSLHKPALLMANRYLGSGRILFGCDCPFWGIGEGLESVRDLDISAEDKESIFFKNAEALLRLA